MNISVHRNNLERACILVERIASKNATLPILSNILLKTEGGRLKICATNLEVAVTTTIGAKVQKEGSIAVPGRVLLDVIRTSSADTVSLSTTNNTLAVEVGTYTTSILCFDPSEYPLIPHIKGGVSFSIPSSIFHTGLSRIADSIAASDARPELAGAYFHTTKQGITLTATDSFRLAEQKIPTSQEQASSVILPRGTVTELIRALNGEDGEVEVRIEENQCAVTMNDYELVSRLIDGRYPDYQKVIPERAASRVLVKRGEFESAIKVAALFSSSISDIKIECSEKVITLSASNSAKGQGKATTEANLKGDPFEISLNYHYLLDGLKVISGDNVVLEFTGKGSPFVLRPVDDADFVYLVMPLRGS